MAEVVAYEDSPMAQYLQEINASEALVAEDKPPAANNAADKSSMSTIAAECSLPHEWLKLLTARAFNSQDTLGVPALTTKEMHARIARTLAESGLVAERYTPRPFRLSARSLEGGVSADSSSALGVVSMYIMAAIITLVTLFTLTFRPSCQSDASWNCNRAAYVPLVAVLVVAGIVAALIVRRRSSQRALVLKCEEAIDQFNSTMLKCRAMDSTVQRALRLVTDVDFVTRGFRLPQYRGSLAISSATGHGTAWMANHVRRAIDSALSQSMDTLAYAIERSNHQQQGQGESFLSSDTRARMADLKAQLGELELESLEALKHKFALHFAMRKLWLESVLRTLEPYANSDAQLEQLVAICNLLRPDIERVCDTASASTSRVKEASEAQYTARKWASLAASKANPTTNHHPLVRALGSMSETLEVVRAKILVCRECVSMVAGECTTGQSLDDGADFEASRSAASPEEIARVFASLKSDIDALNHLYQASVTSLAFCDSDSNLAGDCNQVAADSIVGAEPLGVGPGSTEIPDGATVFGYTPVGVDDLDAPELVFEADVEQEADQGRQRPSNIDRSERIRLSKQKRAEEVSNAHRSVL
ncbi:hypothetical protein GGH95_001635 [Coemansia sp. RSA 1836]|nr:hypothetical protein GGH95_001635 [Coemansia sp. RSA 1836]